MTLCGVCRNLNPATITEDESCKLQDWDRMKVLADEGCAGCGFFWKVISTYSGDDNEYSWGNIGFIDPHAKRHSSVVQALVTEGCGSCRKIFAAINDETRFKVDDWEDWDTLDENGTGSDTNNEYGGLEIVAREGCLGCPDLIAEYRTKAVCLVRYTSRGRKPGFAMIVDGYESSRAVEYLLEACSITDFEFVPWINVPRVENLPKVHYLEELSYNRLITQDPTTIIPRMWMHLCSSHTTCGALHDVSLPTRVIRVGTNSNPVVRLHITNGSQGQYAALSHCWGTSRMVKTTTGVFDQFMERIEFATLPRNFQDAIIIARNMEIENLWIDSLCIIQDSPEDWAQESARMAFVYAQSTITIAAMAAKDSSGGILEPRSASHSHPLGSEKNVVFRQKPTSWDHVHNLPLTRRAWTLQEQHLSHRTLYFTDEQIFWECDTATYSECYRRPEDVGAYAQKKRIVGLAAMAERQLLGSTVDDTDFQSLNQRYLAWYNLTEDYSRRALTYSSDKLTAISGLAEVIGVADHRLGDYMAGLWESDLLRGLKWTTGYSGVGFNAGTAPSLRRIMGYTAPSWSWAAYEGPISYQSSCDLKSRTYDIEFYERTVLNSEFDDGGERMDEQRTVTEGPANHNGWSKQHRTYIVDHKIILATEHKFGQVLPGSYVVLFGLTRQLFVLFNLSSQGSEVPVGHQVSEAFFFDKEAYGWEVEKKHTCRWNRPEISTPGWQEYTVLQIAANSATGGVFALILESSSDGNAFERVGFTNIWKGFPWQTMDGGLGWDLNGWERKQMKLV